MHILPKAITAFMALTAFMAGVSTVAAAQDRSAIQKKLESEYVLTKTTADKTDIVTAGAVLTLNKDKLLMGAVSNSSNCTNTYRDGKFTQNTGCKANDVFRRFGALGHPSNTRVFVAGEKFWVTKIDVRDEGVEMDFFTDAISDVRYKSSLFVPFKDGLPAPDEALKMVQEVVTAAPVENAKQESQPSQAAPAAAPAPAAEAAPPPIPPPPPPPDQPPPTVSLGQTPDQVVAILGQPVTKGKVGAKEIYSYKDLKVIFVNGKVKDIQ